ncbi:2-amino-4-hydroxy-6-hydroxymethyldihydropteridine diphosphokinase [Porticoccus sp. W117]|uniref:2-amino-4-hydroxy-6- hydroxymethyldihydropteridine diphosphokinase n=1 Tax=Porticoccus sp. W117 TaxID=3054777 RepID=UPI002596AF2B|nr:2-amino-4-hydroxy-6-hydroxymethyldihydropteridine diphosphokinase [Porticoccus sp. W117]MDM3872412.1 2-amino-4-hydroxy-6-hydroxymethyldihydropteridine diphosphokinase [Porticoccus sp. W117]
MTIAYIALGSNLAEPLQQVSQGLDAIANLSQCQLLDHSPWYRSAPVGPRGQPDYINGVCAIETTLQPLPLLHQLQNIENQQGRVRSQRWGARTLDLDILLYGDLTLNTPELQLPHPRMAERNFVLLPLADIAADLVMPDNRPLTQLLANCPSGGIVRL